MVKRTSIWALTFLAGVSALSWSVPAQGSELRIRKELVAKQAGRALIVAHGRFDHVKSAVNGLADDCDLHAPVRVDEVRVAVVSEFMNACSTGLKPQQVKDLTENGAAEIAGVFRIWFEHPGKKDEVLTEEEPLAAYKTSNPPHAIEIHPVVRAAGQDFFAAVGPIEKDGKTYPAKGPTQLRTLLKRNVTIQEFDGEDGESYVSIESGCCLANYFRLVAVLTSAPKKTEDGHSAVVNIVSGETVVSSGLRIFSIDGTNADAAFKALKKNAKFTFWGITRMDGKKVLQALEDSPGKSMPIPVEFVLLAVEQ